ncbi:MAG: hypothetical protein ACM3UU_10110 [Ignavibacteriales bacterium]
MEESGVQNTQDFSNTKRPGKGKAIAIVIVFILVLLAAGALVVVNFFPEVVFSPKIMYLMAEKQNITLVEKQIDDYLNDGFVQDSLKTFSTPYSNNSNLTFKYKLDNLEGQGLEQIKLINELLSKSKLVINSSTDNKNEKSKAEIKLNVGGNDLVTAEMFADKKKIGVKLPTFYSKYILVNGDDLAPVYQKFGQPVQMKKIVTNSDIMKAIKFDKKDAYALTKEYSEYIAKQLKDSNFKFAKGVNLQTNEGNISCNQVSLNLTVTEFKDLSIKVLEKVQNDDKLLNLTAGNVINIMKLYEEAGYYGTAGLPIEFKDINSVKQKIKEAIDELKNDTTINGNKSELNMTLLVDRKLNILERKINIIRKGTGSDTLGTATIRFAGFKQPKSNGIENIFEYAEEENAIYSKFVIDAVQAPMVQGKPVTTAINFETLQKQNGTEIKPLSGKVDLTNEGVKDKSSKITANFEVKMPQAGMQNGTVKGIVTIDSSREPAKNIMNTNLNLDIDVLPPSTGLSTNGFGMILGMNSNTTFGGTVDLPSVNASNSLDLNTASMQEIQEAMMQIQTELQKFVMQNAQLLSPSGM